MWLWSHFFFFNTASQMWCLAQLLPIIIGEMVPVDDEHWQNFLDLLVIIDYVFAPVISLDSAAFLHDAICSHHEQFCRLCPGRSITPKLHYMIHIPEWILKWVLNANVSIWVVTINFFFFNTYYLLPFLSFCAGLVHSSGTGACDTKPSIAISKDLPKMLGTSETSVKLW